jgi:hypothetical protein
MVSQIERTDFAFVQRELAGSGNGWIYPRHVLTVLTRSAYDARLYAGAYIGRPDDPVKHRQALIFNIGEFDPKLFQDFTTDDLRAVLEHKDHPYHQAFERMNIRKQPLFERLGAGLDTGYSVFKQIETLKSRKHFLESNPELCARMVEAAEHASYPFTSRDQELEDRPSSFSYANQVQSHILRMSKKDRKVARIFEPCAEEFEDADFAKELNYERAKALELFHDQKFLRDHFVRLMFEIECEFENKWGQAALFLSHSDRLWMKAHIKAGLHGLRSSAVASPMAERLISLGQFRQELQQILDEPDLHLSSDENIRKIQLTILQQSALILSDMKKKLYDPKGEYALNDHDLRLCGLDDSRPHIINSAQAATILRTPQPIPIPA